MDSANKAQKMVSANLSKGLSNTSKIATQTKGRLKQLLGDMNLGAFGNIIVSFVVIYILFKIGWAILNGFDYNNKMDFIKQSFYYWAILLAIMVAYAALG